MAKKTGLIEGAPLKVRHLQKGNAALEAEFRRYVKRDGGFRKGLPEKQKKIAKQLMKKLGREKLEWDLDILPA